MARFVILRGIPASGKSTYARTLVAQGFKRVNKDEIRLERFNVQFEPRFEKEVNRIALELIDKYLREGHDVVSDNTNISGDFLETQFAIAKRYGIEPEVQTFDIPVEEAIRRDALRVSSVGEAVIRHMAKMLRERPLKHGLPKAIIVDLDGTVADTSERVKVASSKAKFLSQKWYDAFFDPKLVPLDVPIGNSAEVLQDMAERYKIVYLTGRRHIIKEASLDWLSDNGYPEGEVITRPTGVKTVEYKERILSELRSRYELVYAFDDNDDNISMYKQWGIPNVIKVTGADAWVIRYSAPLSNPLDDLLP